MSDPPKVPTLHFGNKIIARRHFRSLVLQEFFSEIDLGTAQLFNIWGTTSNYLDKHLNTRLTQYIHTNRNPLIRRTRDIISPTLHDQINTWLNELPAEMENFCHSRDGEDQLFGSLLNSGLLPKYAFPVDVVSLTIPEEDNQGGEDESSDILQRDLKIAISEYAPGAEITRQSEQRTYKYTSVGIHDPFEPNPSYLPQGLIIECPSCQHLQVIDNVQAPVPQACPVCASTHLRTMNFIRLKGFTVDGAEPNGGRKAYNALEGVERGNQLSAAKLLMGENSVLSPQSQTWFNGRLKTLVNVGDLLIVNKGTDRNNPGYNLCPSCGRQIDPLSTEPHRRPADVPPNHGYPGNRGPRRRHWCPTVPPYADVKMVLSHRFHSEVLLMSVKLPLSMDAPFTESSGLAIWYSLGTIIAMAASRTLQIDTSEIKVGVRALNQNNNRIHGEIFIYDDVPGGAGYARAIRDNLEKIIEVACSMAGHCINDECSDACYQCMLDYKNQSYHNILSRDLASSILNYILAEQEPVPTEEEIALSLNSFSEYARAHYQILHEQIINGIRFPLVLQHNDGMQCAIQFIHPLQARPAMLQRTQMEQQSNISWNIFTTVDMIKRPFWVLNNLRFL